MTTKVKLIADGAITPDQITLTTASAGTNTTAPATTAFVQQEITALVDSSPAALNTLNELAAALGDDANFSTTVTNSIATKAPLASPDFTGDVTFDTTTLVVDATNDRVGIGTTSPDVQLEVAGPSGNSSTFKLSGRPDWTAGNGQYNVGNIFGENLGAGVNTTRIKLDGDDTSGTIQFFTANSGSLTSAMVIDSSQNITMSGTGALTIPKGTTAQRPSSPANGMLRYNTTLAIIEEYRDSSWKSLSDAFSGSGGVKTTSGSYTYHTFTSSGSITFSGSGTIDILVVAGGGGGGDNSNLRGAGGGAGGLIFISSYPVASTTYTVSVGSGGAEGASGTNSVFSYSGGTTLTALGGGAGGYNDSTDNGADGGSGGGNWYPGYAGASGIQPANTNDGANTYNSTGFGNDGGTSGSTPPYGSGGGGAGAAGGNFNATGGPVGGAGKDMSATFGTSVGESGWFAGGGGSGSYPPNGDVKYDGGQGGGGRGWNGGTESEQNATANTGGGGGSGGSGGSGIVILRYLT